MSRETVGKRLREMRDDMITLVFALNGGGDFITAAEAQSIVVTIAKFEEDHAFEDDAWPPVADPEGGLMLTPHEDDST